MGSMPPAQILAQITINDIVPDVIVVPSPMPSLPAQIIPQALTQLKVQPQATQIQEKYISFLAPEDSAFVQKMAIIGCFIASGVFMTAAVATLASKPYFATSRAAHMVKIENQKHTVTEASRRNNTDAYNVASVELARLNKTIPGAWIPDAAAAAFGLSLVIGGLGWYNRALLKTPAP